MKKRILSIVLAICLVLCMMPVIPTAISAQDKCTCLIQCPYEKNECSVCASGGACSGRKKFVYKDGKGIDNYKNLQLVLDFKVASQTLYYFYLENDITLPTTMVVPNSPFYAEMVLDLNGHTIDGLNKGANFTVYGSLTVIDTVGTGKIINAVNGAFNVRDGGYLLMQGGTVEKCYGGGGVNVDFGGTFEMTGGTITDNLVPNFNSNLPIISNVSVTGGGTFIIDGDARILNDMDENSYDGESVKLNWGWDTSGENIYKSTMYANGGIIEGRVLNNGTICSSYEGKSTDIRGTIQNLGTISSGVFTSEVINYNNTSPYGIAPETGIINGGSFAGKVTNNGVINGGEFNAEVENIVGRYGDGNISGGTFNSDVVNQGTITGGTFNGAVDTENGTVEDSAKVSVNFVNENGEAIKTVRVLRGQGVTNEDISELIDPSQYGYRKLKYTVGNADYRDEDKFIDEVRFTEDETVVTVTLIFPITYKITYNLNGGDILFLEREYQVTSDDITLGTPTKDGYVFTGWGGTGLDGNNNMTVTIPKGSIGDREYTAYYYKPLDIIAGYTVIYDTQGGSPIEPKKGLMNSSKVLENVDTPTKAGYRFRYWECGGKRILLADTTVNDLMDEADRGVITLTAVWTEKTAASFGTDVQECTYDATAKAFQIKETTLDGFNVTYRKKGNTVENPVDAGSYDVIVTREEDRYYKAVNVTIPNGLVIEPKEISVTIPKIDDQVYSGNDIEPEIKVYDGEKEIPSSEYTVDYADNINAGTATVTVTDKAGGNYIFSQKSKTFTIEKKAITPTVTMEDYVYGVDMSYPIISGNEGNGDVKVYYSTYDDIATNAAHRTLLDESFNAKTLAAGTYYMTVEVEETQNCTSGISEVISFTVIPDSIPPVISGVEDGKVYCEEQTVTVTEEYLESVKVNGAEVTLDANNQFTLQANGEQTLVATDKAGNETTVKVTVNNTHSCEWLNNGTQYWKKCMYCDYETDKKDIPSFTIDAPDTVCRTQDCEASVTLPSDITDAVLTLEFIGLGGAVDTTVENGRLHSIIEAEGYPSVEYRFNLVVYATTPDGFPFTVSKTVQIQEEHAGGVATCTELAICDTCGEKYGELDNENHTLEKIPASDATVEETGNTEHWRCRACGKYFVDEKGKDEAKPEDTVIEKLPPEIINGDGQSVATGSNQTLSFRSNALFGDFIRFEIDGETVDPIHYTVTQGSTIVTLNADYVATLSPGEHTIGIVSASGTATAAFTVNAISQTDKTTKSPETGSNINTALILAFILSCGGVIVIASAYGKRKKEL